MTVTTFLADRRVRWTAIGLGSLAALLVLGVAMFPFEMFRERLQTRLSERFGSAVTVGAIERQEPFSFHPTIVIRDVRVPQPGWAGQGDLARIATARLKIGALPLLIGRFNPRGLAISGMQLSLIRDANGRKNYDRDEQGKERPRGKPRLTGLTIADSRITYRDAKRDRSFDVGLASDPARGVRIAGTGMIRGGPVKIAATGPAIESFHGAWPFRAVIDGPKLQMSAAGTMDSPLDTGHMVLDATARADDLQTIDAVIEAGLFGTQPVKLRAHVRHDDHEWVISRLSGSIGRSQIAGNATVEKADGRSYIKGSLISSALDFNDFSSDEGRARGAAKARALGPRIVPDTKVDLTKLGHTDGQIDFRIDHLLFNSPMPFTTMRGTVSLDHQLLTIRPLQVGLTRGRISGSAVSNQRDGRRVPIVTLDLALSGSRIATFGGAGVIDAPLRGWLRLTGPGRTIRDAVGRSDGTIAFFAAQGTIPARAASLLGLDVGRGLLSDKAAVAGLRCMAIRLDAHGGIARVNPVLLDTTRSTANATGTVRLSDETVELQLNGAPKKGSLLRLDKPISVSGNFQSPTMMPPPNVASVGGVLRMLGNAIFGKQAPLATDVDCGALAARTLRR
ncbi:hypothetical protein BH09PSE4_BH09PSE4_03080 [soil metagenome]